MDTITRSKTALALFSASVITFQYLMLFPATESTGGTSMLTDVFFSVLPLDVLMTICTRALFVFVFASSLIMYVLSMMPHREH